MAFEFFTSKDDGDELKRPTRGTPRPPAQNPEETQSRPVGEGEATPPRLEDLFEAAAPTVLALFLVGAALFVLHATRKNARVVV